MFRSLALARMLARLARIAGLHVALGLLALPAIGAEARSNVERVRADVRGKEPEANSNSSDPEDSDDGANHDLIGAALAPGPSSSSDTSGEKDEASVYFLSYPYQFAEDFAVFVPERRSFDRRRTSVHVTAEGAALAGGTDRFAARARLVLEGWRFETGFDMFAERKQDQSLALGELLGGWQFSAAWFAASLHGGVRWLDNGRGHSDYGWNLGSQWELMPGRPWILSARFDGGMVGQSRLLRARATLGVMLNRVEVYGGYDALIFETVTLHGPMAGLGFWY